MKSKQHRLAELAQTWLINATSDLEYARWGLDGGFYPQVCFNCHQVAEKALKAYLLARQQEPPRIHFLPGLLRICENFDPDFRRLHNACAELTPYYIDTRYPDSMAALRSYDRGVAKEAVQSAAEILAVVQEKMKELLPS